MGISVIKKRDGRIVPFDVQKITNAIRKSFLATDPAADCEADAESLALEVYTLLELEGNPAPTVEHVQDIVEQVLMREGHTQTAKNYILYRQERSRIRQASDADESRFGGAPVSLHAALSGCESIEDAVFAAFTVLQERHGQTVSDFPQAMENAVHSSFLAAYRRAVRCGLALLAGCEVNARTQAAWTAGLAQKELAITLEGAEAALSREADLICGTLGCDRVPVEKIQAYAHRAAAEEVAGQMEHAVLLLCAACGVKKSALQGAADSAEARLVKKIVNS